MAQKVMRNIFRKLFKKNYKHLVEINIYRQNILDNIDIIQKITKDWRIAPVLKSNAYGHGLLEVAKVLEYSQQVDFYCVDSLYEANLIHRKTKRDILILGYTPIENIINFKYTNVMYTIGSIEELEIFSSSIDRKQRIYLKFNAGMNRRGIDFIEKDKAFEIVTKNKNIIVHGVYSHFADADNADEKKSLEQIREWNEIVNFVKNKYKEIKNFHLSATGGIKFYNKIDASHLRLGFGMYGFDPNNKINLSPALEVVSQISQIRNVKRGDGVGYGFTFIAERDMQIATIPFGYYEGLFRKLSNVGHVKIGDNFCKIIGRVSMNVISIDMSDIKNIKIGDRVTVISKNKADKNSIENIARICETIPYEILVKINGDLKRNIV